MNSHFLSWKKLNITKLQNYKNKSEEMYMYRYNNFS